MTFEISGSREIAASLATGANGQGVPRTVGGLAGQRVRVPDGEACDLDYIRIRCRICPECGEEWSWKASMTDGAHPKVHVGGFQYYVRRIVWSITHGKPIKDGYFVGTKCPHPRCVNPELLTARSRSVAMSVAASQGAWKGADFSIAVSLGRAKANKITDEQAAYAATVVKPVAEVAEELGISTAYVYMLRRGDFRRAAAVTPFSGLLMGAAS